MRISIPGIGGNLGECILCGDTFLKEILLNQTVPIHKDKCLETLKKNGTDWRTLPDGPLRREFENHFSEKTKVTP
jgi:hypothetical protein